MSTNIDLDNKKDKTAKKLIIPGRPVPAQRLSLKR
jgi:hypothetical protein